MPAGCVRGEGGGGRKKRTAVLLLEVGCGAQGHDSDYRPSHRKPVHRNRTSRGAAPRAYAICGTAVWRTPSSAYSVNATLSISLTYPVACDDPGFSVSKFRGEFILSETIAGTQLSITFLQLQQSGGGGLTRKEGLGRICAPSRAHLLLHVEHTVPGCPGI